MAGLVVPIRMGQFIINPSGVNPGEMETPMRSPGWMIYSLKPLWSMPNLVGENMVIPGSDGRLAYEPDVDELTVILRLYVEGFADIDGDPYLDPFAGLRANYEWLRDNVATPIPGSATRDSKLTIPGGSDVLAPVQIRFGPPFDDKGISLRFPVAVTIPAGLLA